MVFIWKFGIRVHFAGSVLDVYELLPAFLVNLIITVIVSKATAAPDKEIIKVYDEVVADL